MTYNPLLRYSFSETERGRILCKQILARLCLLTGQHLPLVKKSHNKAHFLRCNDFCSAMRYLMSRN